MECDSEVLFHPPWSPLHRLRGRPTLLLPTGDCRLVTLTTLSVYLCGRSILVSCSVSIYLCPPHRTSVLYRPSLFYLSTYFPEFFSIFSSLPSATISEFQMYPVLFQLYMLILVLSLLYIFLYAIHFVSKIHDIISHKKICL